MRSLPLFLLLLTMTSFARLGDTREQAEGRYGLPKSEKASAHAQPLLEGARELTFEYEGWRIRCALLLAKDGQEYVVREEYMKKTGSPSIKDFERDAILRAESNGMKWQEKKVAAFSFDPLKAMQNQMAHALRGPTWVRDDGAVAVHSQGMFPVRLELPQAQKYEAELKAIKDQQARQKVPKF